MCDGDADGGEEDKKEERARAAALARGRRAHLTKDSSRLLLNLEGVAGSDGVVDALEHRSDGSQAEQMRCPDRRSALAAGSDDSPVSATAGGPALVVRGDFVGSAPGAPESAWDQSCLLSVGKAGWFVPGSHAALAASVYKSQPRTGHTREPDPKHLEQKHKTTHKTATHERTPDRQTSHSLHVHVCAVLGQDSTCA